MKKRFKRGGSFLIVVIMLLTMFQTAAFATEPEILAPEAQVQTPATAGSADVNDLAKLKKETMVGDAHRSTQTPDIYVSPNGDDKTGDGSKQKPFKSLKRAKDAVESLPKTKDIVVEFADGLYEMTDTVVLGPQDSGNENCTIYYQAAPGAKPVISGGKKLTGKWETATDVDWLKGGLTAYKTTLNRDAKLRAIYVNGERANMTEKTGVTPVNNSDNIPRYSFYASGTPQYNYKDFYVAGQHATNDTAHIIRNQPWIWMDRLNVIGGTKFRTADLPPNTRNAQNIEFSAKESAKWVWPLACVAKTEVDPVDPTCTIAHLQMPYNALAQSMEWGTAYSRTNTHVIYNVFEHLGKAGDFYFDDAKDTLYYIPRAGESMETAEVVIPQLVHLVDITGTTGTDKYVTNLTFSGLSFNYADWNLYKMGESYGYSTVQTATMFIAMANGNWHNDMYRSYDVVPSAITVNKAKNIRFLDGSISFTGANGIHLENDVSECEVTGNSINRVGHAGVVVGHPQHLYENDTSDLVVGGTGFRAGIDKEKFAFGTESVPKNIYVTNNYFYRTGYMFPANNNFISFFTQNLQVMNNFFFDVPCSSLMIGWGWCNFDGSSGSQLPGKPTHTSFNNKASYNRIENYCANVDDAGGIYSLSTQGKEGWVDSSEMNYNFLNGSREGNHTGWVNGFHPDEGSKFINFTGNVIQKISRSVYEFNDFARKSDMNVYQGFSDIKNLFGTEAPRTTLDLTVIPDRTWPQMGHDVVLNSGLTDEYLGMVQKSVMSAVDYELASRVQYRPGMQHHRRGLLSATDEVWIAPRNTTTFVEGETMTKSAGNAKSMDIPSKEGTYTLYIRRANETVEVSQFDIVISGRPISVHLNIKDGAEYKVSAINPLVLEIDEEYYDDLRLNGRTVKNSDVIGTKGTWTLSLRNKETQETDNYTFTTDVTDANKLLTKNISVGSGAEIKLNNIGLGDEVDLWIAGSGDSSLPDDQKGWPTRGWAKGTSTTIKAPITPGVYALHVTKTGTSASSSDARVTVIDGVKEIVNEIKVNDADLWTNKAWDNATKLEVNKVAEKKKGEPAKGVAKLLWGNDKLYVRVDVTDADINYANSATYLQDSVEVYLSEMNFKGSYNGTQGNQYRVTVPGGGAYGAKTSHAGVTSSKTLTETGYSIFLSIPSRSGGFSDGQLIGFDVQINDATTPEGNRTGQTSWSDPAANGYNSSAAWGELALVGVRPKLADLSINPGKLKPDFNPKIKEYTVSVDVATSSAAIIATGMAGTTVTGDGSQNLTGTDTELQVIVTDPMSGITNTYKIKVTKVLSGVPQEGLDLWLMADKGVTAGSDGVVTSWVNQVTTGAAISAAFTPTAVNFQPKIMTDNDNGYKYVYFDGTAIAGPISLKSTAFKNYNGKQALTVITVALPESDPNSNGDQGSAVWMGEDGGWGGTYFSPGATKVNMRLGSGITANDGSSQSSSFSRTKPTALVTDAFVFNAGTHIFYENGIQKSTVTGKNTPINRNLTDLNIGGTASASSPAPFKGQLAEVLVYDRALSPAEIMSIQAFIADKYSKKAPVGSDDATLKSLSVSSGTLTPNFSPDVFNYTAEVGSDVDTITISAIAKDENATVIGDSVTYPLNVGKNSLYVVVTSEDGEVKLTYKIVIARVPAIATYTVTYDLNGGAGEIPVDTKLYHAGDTITLAAGSGLSKANYTFTGWSLTPGGSAISTPTATMGSSNTTYYAVWTAVSTQSTIPTNLSATATGTSSINLNWTAVSGATGYNIYCAVGNGEYIKLTNSPVTMNSYTSTGLNPATTYYYKVTAVNSAGESERSAAAFAQTNASSGSGGTGGGSTSGGSTSGGSTGGTVTPVSSDIEVKPVLSGSTANASITADNLKKALDVAKADSNGTKTVTLKVSEVKGAESYTLELPKTSLTSGNGSLLKVESPVATVVVPGNAFDSNLVNGDKVKLTIGLANKDAIKDENVKQTIGDRPVIEVIASADGSSLSLSNPEADVKVSLAYKPTSEELKNPEHITVWGIDENGEAKPVTSGRYDAGTGKVTFTANNFGSYAVVYVNKTFADIDNYAWAKEKIEVMAAKGVINGTSETTYSPANDITRADFIVLLVKSLGLNAKADDNFEDVKEGSYYYDAIAIAKKLGITTGVGDNKFDPKVNISRQDMMVLAEKALRIAGKDIDSGSAADIAGYNDATQVAGYAKDAIASLVKEGIIKGSDNKLNPKLPANRAETAVIIYNLYNK